MNDPMQDFMTVNDFARKFGRSPAWVYSTLKSAPELLPKRVKILGKFYLHVSGGDVAAWRREKAHEAVIAATAAG